MEDSWAWVALEDGSWELLRSVVLQAEAPATSSATSRRVAKVWRHDLERYVAEVTHYGISETLDFTTALDAKDWAESRSTGFNP